MPELPEVEAISLKARRHALERRVKGVRVLRGRYLEGQIVLLVDKYLKEVYRRGKYVLFELMDVYGDTVGWLQCHNAMSGYWDYAHDPWTFDYVEGRRIPKQSDVRVELDLDPGGGILRFHDARLFGRLRFCETLALPCGPEALATERLLPGSPIMTREEFQESLKKQKGQVKPVLMDQTFMAGVGNIYATEACGWAGIRPDTPAHDVGADRAGHLFDVLQELLRHNIPEIRYGWLRFYRRRKCSDCGSKIETLKQVGRTTWYCPKCQR